MNLAKVRKNQERIFVVFLYVLGPAHTRTSLFDGDRYWKRIPYLAAVAEIGAAGIASVVLLPDVAFQSLAALGAVVLIAAITVIEKSRMYRGHTHPPP